MNGEDQPDHLNQLPRGRKRTYKRWLGPDSTEEIPARSRRRLEAQNDVDQSTSSSEELQSNNNSLSLSSEGEFEDVNVENYAEMILDATSETESEKLQSNNNSLSPSSEGELEDVNVENDSSSRARRESQASNRVLDPLSEEDVDRSLLTEHSFRAMNGSSCSETSQSPDATTSQPIIFQLPQEELSLQGNVDLHSIFSEHSFDDMVCDGLQIAHFQQHPNVDNEEEDAASVDSEGNMYEHPYLFNDDGLQLSDDEEDNEPPNVDAPMLPPAHGIEEDNQPAGVDAPLLPPVQGNEIIPHDPVPIRGFETLTQLLQDGYSDVITERAGVSRGEALHMALSTTRTFHFSFTAFMAVVNLINNIFTSGVLPHSNYLMDKILKTDMGSHFHFFCSNCKRHLGELHHRVVHSVECPGCETNNHIHNLCEATYFIMFDIDFQCQLLFLNDDIADKLSSPFDLVQNDRPRVLRDIYDGSQYRSFVEKLGDRDDTKHISFIFNTDGTPLFKSSKFSIWPISLILNELPVFLRMRKLLPGGLWFGKEKPTMSMFLGPFASHVTDLSHNGFIVNRPNGIVWNMKAYVIAGCFDSGARGIVQGLQLHTGYFSCNWCEHPGLYVNNAVRFPLLPYTPTARTTARIVQQAALAATAPDHVCMGVKERSPLIDMPMYDIVSSNVVESLHLIDLGIAKNTTMMWIFEAQGPYYIGAPENLTQINNRIEKLRPPIEVRRLPRTMKDSKRFKGREWENWTYFFSYPVLKGILPARYLNCWLIFVQAMYLLNRAEVSEQDVNNAHYLLKYFCWKSEELYGRNYMVFNMHIVSHIAENVKLWGPLWCHSAYAFENALYDLKEEIHAARGVQHQIIRSFSFAAAEQVLTAYGSSPKSRGFVDSLKSARVFKGVTTEEGNFLGRCKAFQATPEENHLCADLGIDTDLCVEYQKLIVNKTVYRSVPAQKTNNTYAQLVNKSLVLVRKIVLNEGDGGSFVIASSVRCESILQLPPELGRFVQLSKDDHCVRKIAAVSEDSILVPVTQLKTVCCLSANPDDEYIIPAPNVFNVV